ncbi:MAG TPA: histidine kinase, partial [Gammaproteobacteria bacterium]|nr:histidine kinase [Gammaproteobacteria bacterium]
NSAGFFAVHAVLATLFATAWMAWELLLLGPTGPVRPPDYEMWRYVLPWQALIGFILYGVVAGVSYAVRGVVRTRDLTISAERADRLRAQAELAALRAHINPHFLFNTLHAVMQLQRESPRHGEAALEHMADLFAYVLRLERHGIEAVALEDEWRFTESYLWLERTRLGDKLRVRSCIDDEALACSLPPFTIQPLVENAIRHGIVPARQGGTVRITARENDGILQIEVADDGPGADPARPDASKGLGERVVARRLAARYGARASVSVTTAPNAGYCVRLSLPAEPHIGTAMRRTGSAT